MKEVLIGIKIKEISMDEKTTYEEMFHLRERF